MRPLWNTKDRYIHNIFIPANFLQIRNDDGSKLQTRRWSKPGEDGHRFSTEILLVPGGRVQFLDRPNGANSNVAAMADGQAPVNDSAVSTGDDEHMAPDLPF